MIEGDPALKAARTTIRATVGTPDDLDIPPVAAMPCLQLTTGPGGTGWENEGQHRSDLLVKAKLWVKGTRSADLLNFWGALRTAIFPPVGSPRQLAVKGLMAPLVENGEMVAQAFGNVDVDEVACQVAEGAIRLRINVNT